MARDNKTDGALSNYWEVCNQYRVATSKYKTGLRKKQKNGGKKKWVHRSKTKMTNSQISM